MSRSGLSASPGVSSPGLAFLDATLAGIFPLALASGCGGTAFRAAFDAAAALAVSFGSGLALAVAWVFAAGLTAAAGLAAGLDLETAFFAGTGLAGACFFNGFACFF